MNRRAFVTGLGAVLAAPLGAWAQGATPSLLAEGKPSRTPQATANLRAAHQLLDQPRIFDDPLALRIIGAQAEAAVRANLGRSPSATFRPFVAVRSRYAEDELARAVQRGVRQYVVLGAGTATRSPRRRSTRSRRFRSSVRRRLRTTSQVRRGMAAARAP
jgi:hypothetical protein